MDEYLQERETLQAVFHLIDARHGPTDEDIKIMQKVGTILGAKQQAKEHCAKYIIILTKADKNVKNAKTDTIDCGPAFCIRMLSIPNKPSAIRCR